MLHALVAEDDDRHVALLADTLRGLAHVQHVTDADAALAALEWVVPDVVLADVRGCSRVSLAEHAASLRLAIDRAGARARVRTRIPLVLVSALDPDLLAEAVAPLPSAHAHPKPFVPSALRALVARITGVTE